ncbi:conserved domain protein [Mycoplasmopsis alligatoris A21JP2]|uniref:Conserved domain protein n=1 Tax=Mycoplasmopsis alligatoris A21JP2 TaxID=747682 RepID=D4XVR0_9BACT|nr:conserved domain protein [Mycoplasmopsis alligatoris A21JP2]
MKLFYKNNLWKITIYLKNLYFYKNNQFFTNIFTLVKIIIFK